jgi:hypothetical protein
LHAWIESRQPVVDDRAPVLVESDYRGYNVIRLKGRFYGIRQDDGGFDVDRYRQGRYRNAVDGPDLPTVNRQIDAISTTAASERTRS